VTDLIHCTLDDVLELQRGHDLPATIRGNGNVPVIGSFGITGFHDVAKYGGPGVAIGRSGASIGVATYCASEYWPLNTCLFVKDFRNNDPRWVFYLLDSIDFSGFNSGSAVPSLNRNYLKGIPVLLPELAEQRAIAGLLGALDDKIEANRRLARASQDLARAEYESAIRDNPQRLPLADLVVPVNDRNPAIRRSTPYVGLEHFDGFDLALWNFGVAEDSTSATKVAQSGDLLFGRIRPYFGNVAVVGREAVVAQSVEVLRAKNPEFREVAYLGLSSREFIEIATTLSHGTTMPQVKWNELSRLELSVPTDENILALHKRLLPLFELITSLPREFEYLTCLRDAMLPGLLSGRLRIKDAESMMEDV